MEDPILYTPFDNAEEDWTGLSDKKKRKQLQNRINQRARRRLFLVHSSCDLSTDPPGQERGNYEHNWQRTCLAVTRTLSLCSTRSKRRVSWLGAVIRHFHSTQVPLLAPWNGTFFSSVCPDYIMP